MSTASVSVPEGSVDEAGGVTALLDMNNFCKDFCDWVKDEWSIDSLTPDTQQSVESRSSPASADTASASHTERPTEAQTGGSLMCRFQGFLKRSWKTIKKPFVFVYKRTRVESPTPQLNPHQSDPEPVAVPDLSELQQIPDTDPAVHETSPVPDLSDCKPNNGSFNTFYEVVDLLEFGNFGPVFKGIRKSDGQEVAIKSIHKKKVKRCGFTSDRSRPLETEVVMMLILRRSPVSPYIIKMYEWFDRPQVISLILEYPQPCKVLREFINQRHKLSEPMARHLMRQLLLAVQHCLDHNVFHNDIHADNILVNTCSLELKLIDFGSAHLVDKDGFDSAQYIGAFEYCPPEVLKWSKYHAVPTNVWALGIVLYVMVNGHLPFANIQETLKAWPPWNPKLSIACRDLISQCLNPVPAKRLTLQQISRHKWFR